MVDVSKLARLQGFNVSVADIGDQMHLCHPLLSFEGDSALYLAHRLDWRDDANALTVADPEDASSLGTLLPSAHRQRIAPGQGVVAAGAGFVEAAAIAAVPLLDCGVPLKQVGDTNLWMGVATLDEYEALRARLTKDACTSFDRAVGAAMHPKKRLPEQGNAALLVMRRCGAARRDDLAIRQLAGERHNEEFDVYRRLLIRFALELKTPEDVLHERVSRHMEELSRIHARRGHPMSLRVHEADALRAISPASFSAYARLNGWEKAEQYGEYSDVYAAAGLPEVVLPRTRRLADYADVASRLVRIFAREAGVDELELLRDLTTADRDAIRVRASCEHTVAVDDGLVLIGGAKEMISAAVRSLFEPAAAYSGRLPKEVSDYMRRVRLAGMEQGSFVVTLLPPAVPAAVDRIMERPSGGECVLSEHKLGSALDSDPIERQATRRLADALAATRQAMAEALGGEGDAFGNAISSGTSANLCHALADMTASFEALDVSLTWALTRPPPNMDAATRFAFAKDDSWILRKAARALRKRKVQVDFRMTATVEGLRRQHREVILRAQLNGVARSVVAHVTKADYERAIEVHKANADVVLTGDLEHTGRRYRLLNPHIVA